MLLNFFKIRTDDTELAIAVRVALLKALYSSHLSLIIGTSLGLAISGLVAWYCPNPWIILCGVLISATGLLRVLSFGMFKPGSADANARIWERIYETGAFAYALFIGQLTLLSFIVTDDLRSSSSRPSCRRAMPPAPAAATPAVRCWRWRSSPPARCRSPSRPCSSRPCRSSSSASRIFSISRC